VGVVRKKSFVTPPPEHLSSILNLNCTKKKLRSAEQRQNEQHFLGIKQDFFFTKV
jgi:hypothetical protein